MEGPAKIKQLGGDPAMEKKEVALMPPWPAPTYVLYIYIYIYICINIGIYPSLSLYKVFRPQSVQMPEAEAPTSSESKDK